jgi:hypothetical protein
VKLAASTAMKIKCPRYMGLRVSVSAFDDDAFRRDVEGRAAAAIRHAVSSHESGLQVAPNEQECTRRMDHEHATDANPVQMR